jgi:hypothetical protein
MDFDFLQEEICRIASYYWNLGVTLTTDELRSILNMGGYSVGEGRGFFKQIGCSYHNAVKNGNQNSADCIANCITKNDGSYAWA